AVLLALVVLCFAFRAAKPHQEDSPEPEGDDELFLSAEARQGRGDDPKAVSKWEEEQRQRVRALLRREEAGPVRITLRAVPGAAARKEPEVEVELTNDSKETVLISIHRDLFDGVTFILQGPDGKVVSRYRPIMLHSLADRLPPIP